MREDFLHYLWRLARFDLRRLTTTEGESVTIQDFGIHNTNAGPDFGQARLRVAGLQWAGKVEMHVNSSQWYDHGHETDPAYDGVILHVVLHEDRIVYRRDGSRIPCLELHGRIPPNLAKRYYRLMHNEYWIPCQNQLSQVDDAVRERQLQTMLAERLVKRSERFANRLELTQRDWEESFYQSLARALGGRINADAMDMLALSVPLRIVLKHKHSLLQLEALFFGQSGLLPEEAAGEDPYVTLLRREYCLLRTKHSLRAIPEAAWRFLRLRPNNFPTVRIAQLACLLFRTGQLFGKILAAEGAKELENMFVVSLSNYWKDHYRFGKEGKHGGRRLGDSMVRSILINAVAPAYFVYGNLREDDRYRDRATTLLAALPPEKNSIVAKWSQLGWEVHSAADTQALLELKSNYCAAGRCTECAIGCSILNRGPEHNDVPLLTMNEEAVVYGLVG